MRLSTSVHIHFKMRKDSEESRAGYEVSEKTHPLPLWAPLSPNSAIVFNAKDGRSFAKAVDHNSQEVSELTQKDPHTN